MTKVKQLANNQFIINGKDENNNEVEWLQSYDSIIVRRCENEEVFSKNIYLDQKYWNYSKTTSKYRNKFLGETTKETQAKIDSGDYILTDLNR